MTTALQPPAPLLERLVTLHAAVYEVMEAQLSPGGLKESDRPLVPLFRRWLDTARQTVAAARQLPPAERPTVALGDLLRAINRSNLVAEEFDEVVALNQR